MELIDREKRELRQALGTLTSAVTYVTARLDQHQRREDQWRELLRANNEAKQELVTTQENAQQSHSEGGRPALSDRHLFRRCLFSSVSVR